MIADKESYFVRKIREWVKLAISQGVVNFEDLLNQLPSVYPTKVVSALSKLTNEGYIDASTFARLQPRAISKLQLIPTAYSLLPLPHPLDYEWRFSNQSARLLFDIANCYCRSGKNILLFGTPGLALHALLQKQKHPIIFSGEDNLVTKRLIDLNSIIEHSSSVHFCKSPALTHRNADVVILDPPWYLDFFRPMLEIAAGNCSLDGCLLVSFPPEGSQSSAVEDRQQILADARRLGLREEDTYPLTLVYETPFFEQNALAACGVHVRNPWRRSDLVVFRKVAETNCLFKRLIIPERNSWRQIAIGRMRLFVQRETVHGERRSLRSLVKGDILPTVSRHDPRRDCAQVWTPGNRIFASSSPNLVALAAQTVPSNLGFAHRIRFPGNVKVRKDIEQLSYMLQDIMLTEIAEEKAMYVPDQKYESILKFGNSSKELVHTQISKIIDRKLWKF
ncbi:MAG: hypothetical protein OXF09_01495 [Hyphomicrobiales bacterium]|nr:hypothetical protein [Hyphomicrobiales bacterium]